MCPVLYNDRMQMCSVVVLQNCVGFVEGETASCNEADVDCDPLEIKEEVSMKVEDAIDIKDEIPETIAFPTEQEVRLWGVYVVLAAHAFRPFTAPK